jgi:chromosome segregation ATPase
LHLLNIKLDTNSASSAFIDRVYEELGISRDDCTFTDAIDELKKRLDRSARLRSNICTALCLGHESCDGNIIGRIHMMQDCHDKLCKDYTELRKAIWEAMNRKPETLPEETARLVGEVRMLQMNFDASQKQVKGFTNRCDSLENLRQDLWEFRKNAIEDLKNRGFFFRPEEDEDLPEIFVRLLKRYDYYFNRYKEQYCLRQQWHVRYESENERANGVQKALDREREKCRVKDISLETAKKQYEKVRNNLETAECALNGMRNKVRSLQKERTKVISAIGQDIWDDCLK